MPVFERQQSPTQGGEPIGVARRDRIVSQPLHADNPLLAQQQPLGNQAVQRLLRSGKIQAKLTINQPGDEYEQEADRVADAVMRMPDPSATKEAVDPRQAQDVHIQRMCSECEEELGRQPIEEEGEILQTKERPGQPPRITPGVEANIDALRGSGQPLPRSMRAFFEPRFGYDFSQVRIHTDARAADSAQAVSARAFTVGRDVVFGAGQYAPGTASGQRLLAHELTHVVQQRIIQSAPSQTQLSLNPLGGPYEHQVTQPDYVGLRLAPTPLNRSALQRQPVQQPGCTLLEPENCPTYEQWISHFSGLPTFEASDIPPGSGGTPSGHLVIGEGPALRESDSPEELIPSELRAPSPVLPEAERFIDHPTDNWVRRNLPPELRETAYRLPADCADIAVILRHVWLFAHRRTENYRGWRVGYGVGRTESERHEQIRRLISLQVSSRNVRQMVNPYTDPSGRPLQTFTALKNLLHPGDILVWAHHDNGLNRPATGGHTQTITEIVRDPQTGEVTQINVVQGNQPIGEEQAREIRGQYVGRSAPSVEQLQAAPGRRIEERNLTKAEGDLEDRPLPPRRGSAVASPQTRVWMWADGHTTLVVAGPPASARRPAARRQPGQRQAVRSLRDWVPLARSASLADLPGILEAALGEMRAALEGQGVVDEPAVHELGEQIGRRLRMLAHQARDLRNVSRFQPLTQLLGILEAYRISTRSIGNAGRDVIDRVYKQLREALELAARGAASLDSDQVQGVHIQRMCSECEEELHHQPMEEKEVVLGQARAPRIQRVCSECEEELHRQPIEEGEEILQTEEVPGQAARLTPDIEANIDALRGSGQPLPRSVRAFFEPRFGYDFSQVRIHANAVAARTSQELNADAFTIGRDIFFGSSRYDSATTKGKELLAHELTHVVQQHDRSSPERTIQRMVRPGYVSCWHPAQAGHGGLYHPRRTGDDIVATIAAADARAITVAANAETQLASLRRDRATAGYTPPAALRDALLTRFGLDAMTASDRQLALIQRRFRRVREILEGGWISYTCRGSDCEADDWAYAEAGVRRIHLCNRFYDDPTTSINEQGGTILHEAFHIYFPHIEDWEAPALADAHCYEQFARLLLGDSPAMDPCR